MSADVAITQPFTQELLHVVGQLPPAQAQAWLTMAIKKNELMGTLQRMELECQAFLLPVKPPAGFDPAADRPAGKMLSPWEDQEVVRKAMADFKAKQTEMVNLRLPFTKAIDDGIIGKLMEPEKRMNPKVNAEYLATENHELGLRQAASAKTTAADNLRKEITSFKTHFENEYSALDVQYRQDLGQIIVDTYKACLLARTPTDGVPAAISIAKLAMADVKMGTPKPFLRVFIETPEQAMAIFVNIPKPQQPILLAAAHEALINKFELYANDLQNVPVAVATIIEEHKQEVQQQTGELRNIQAANTLFANASALTIAPDGQKGVTDLTRIRILDNSEEWVSRILAAFIKDFGKAFPKIRTRKYQNLTVEQMANALDAIGAKVPGIEYETITK